MLEDIFRRLGLPSIDKSIEKEIKDRFSTD
jgi:hypothetical protein